MRSIKVSNKIIGENQPTFVIAEAGVNHNGKIVNAKKLVDIAVEAGADAVKFQTFKSEGLVTAGTDSAGYAKKNTGRNIKQLEMIKSLELSYKDFITLKNASVVFDTGAYDKNDADDKQALPNGVKVMRGSVEAFYKLKW